jgi:hypothetical protein
VNKSIESTAVTVDSLSLLLVVLEGVCGEFRAGANGSGAWEEHGGDGGDAGGGDRDPGAGDESVAQCAGVEVGAADAEKYDANDGNTDGSAERIIQNCALLATETWSTAGAECFAFAEFPN